MSQLVHLENIPVAPPRFITVRYKHDVLDLSLDGKFEDLNESGSSVTYMDFLHTGYLNNGMLRVQEALGETSLFSVVHIKCVGPDHILRHGKNSDDAEVIKKWIMDFEVPEGAGELWMLRVSSRLMILGYLDGAFEAREYLCSLCCIIPRKRKIVFRTEKASKRERHE